MIRRFIWTRIAPFGDKALQHRPGEGEDHMNSSSDADEHRHGESRQRISAISSTGPRSPPGARLLLLSGRAGVARGQGPGRVSAALRHHQVEDSGGWQQPNRWVV